MMYHIIVAMCINNGIGYKNSLPWKLSSDLKYFSKLTKGNGNNAIIMGRKTWESLPRKPLYGRDNLILTRSTQLPNQQTFSSVDEVIKHCKERNYSEIWVIGGEEIYNEFLKKHIISKLYITHINEAFKCDSFFPTINYSEWNVESEEDVKTENLTYKRKVYVSNQSMDYQKCPSHNNDAVYLHNQLENKH